MRLIAFLQHRSVASCICALLCLSSVLTASAEGTLEAMQNSTQGIGLNISNINTVTSGPYRDAPTENRLRFYLKTGEKLYFGWNSYNRADPNPAQVPVYYRIIRSSDEQEMVVPTLVTPGSGNPGYIPDWTTARNGPTVINGAGYDALQFDPGGGANAEEYFIEIYQSADAGATPQTAQNTVLVYFDFSVVQTAGNVLRKGRVYSQGWSILTYNPANNFRGDINIAMEDNSFFGYTADSTIAKITFQGGFKPLAFVVYFNKYGADPAGGSSPTYADWLATRQSKSQSGSPTTLPDGYNVFLNTPDASVFPLAADGLAPVLKSITGCPGSYSFNVQMRSPGDIRILLDRNGTPGFQAGTSDRYIYGSSDTTGIIGVSWDGSDGEGNPISGNVQISTSSKLLRGRTNLPFFDAEQNLYGILVQTFAPTSQYPMLFWDDTQLATDASCSIITSNNNTTPAGIDVSQEGVSQYFSIGGVFDYYGNRGWDGATVDDPPVVPVTSTAGSGSQTASVLCDDYGNFRILNTWFWTGEVSSTDTLLRVPAAACVVLPVTLTQFGVQKRAQTALLRWSTASESSFRAFILERSFDGRVFHSIATIAGRGTSGRNDYQYSDNIAGVRSARIFYRLRQVDNDGSFRFSRVAQLQTDLQEISLLGGLINPVSGALRFQISVPKAGAAEIRISDMAGRVLLSSRKELFEGTNSIELPQTAGYAPGMYLLRVEAGGVQQAEKFIIHR
ncbi:MAG: T9SS type A sorting domain-containing protein [Chitinophagaceae bacterium]|nr:MAG: T9SS type A sorting domain-containing protein [Chitinophagaceae bacterium]